MEADGTEGYLIATGIASSGNQQHIEIGQGILNGIADKYGLTFEQDIADLVTVAETTNAANDKGILVTLYPGSPNKAARRFCPDPDRPVQYFPERRPDL